MTDQPVHDRLNKEQLAQQLGMSARTIDNLVRRNELPPGVRMGRQYYWSRTVVDRFTERAFAAQENWNPLKSRRGWGSPARTGWWQQT